MAQPGQPPELSTPVYVVDDDPEIRSSLELLLSTAGLEVRTFGSAEAFLAAIDPKDPSCVLLDVRLPGMSGLELLGRLTGEGCNTVVVIVTGHGDIPMAVAAMRAGALHFIEKPLAPAAFLQIVEEARNRAAQLGERWLDFEALTARFGSLTPRESEVLALLVDGHPTKVIAARLGISTRTAEHHRSAIMQKTGARTVSHLVRMSLELANEPRNAQ